MDCKRCGALPELKAITDGRIPEQLTPRERDIVTLVAEGWRNKEVGAALNVTEQTVKNNLRTIFDKLGVHDRVSLTLYSIRQRGQL